MAGIQDAVQLKMHIMVIQRVIPVLISPFVHPGGIYMQRCFVADALHHVKVIHACLATPYLMPFPLMVEHVLSLIGSQLDGEMTPSLSRNLEPLLKPYILGKQMQCDLHVW